MRLSMQDTSLAIAFLLCCPAQKGMVGKLIRLGKLNVDFWSVMLGRSSIYSVYMPGSIAAHSHQAMFIVGC